MSSTTPKTGSLSITLTTWILLLTQRGHIPTDEALAEAAARLMESSGLDAEQRARALVENVEALLGAEHHFERVHELVVRLFGEQHIDVSLGEGDREDRARNARRYQFSKGLPWLALIIDRFPDGAVGPHWIMVEQVSDVVTCMDPYPWDDLDEEYNTPVTDFMVKWELAGARSLRWV